ncbi:MAG: thioesterase family protein, partial [Marmoricola sp.]|nr:thioesterase family protein [Marmoricola sp.]
MRAPRPTRDRYVHWEQVTTRWADIDVYGHMNNARYFELIDTVVNNHLVHGTGTDIRRLPAIGVVAEV